MILQVVVFFYVFLAFFFVRVSNILQEKNYKMNDL